MSINRIEALKRERYKLNNELDACDAFLKNLTRIRGSAKAVIIKLQSRPIESREKLGDAERNLEIAEKDYNKASGNYYKILEVLRRNNMELTQAESVNTDAQRSFRR